MCTLTLLSYIPRSKWRQRRKWIQEEDFVEVEKLQAPHNQHVCVFFYVKGRESM